jgi:seryl-tRNA synthetase
MNRGDDEDAERAERERLDRESKRVTDDSHARSSAAAADLAAASQREKELRDEAERLRFQQAKESEDLRVRMADNEERCRNAETRARDLEGVMTKWEEEKKKKDEEFNSLYDKYKKTQTALVSKVTHCHLNHVVSCWLLAFIFDDVVL